MASNLFDLTGKVALVTGANSGLGLAMAEGLAQSGADLIIWGRREEANARAAEGLRAYGTRVAHFAVDVADSTAVRRAFDRSVEQFGRIDCVIPNAGVAGMVPFDQMSDEAWQDLLSINLNGVFYTAREAARHMKARAEAGDAGGSIILNGSLTVFAGVPYMAHYAAAKGAINSMGKTLATELGAYKVRVNTICPGFILSGLAEGAEVQPVIDATLARTPLKRIGTPDDLQGIVVYLASDRSRHHSGDTITLDGGMMAQNF